MIAHDVNSNHTSKSVTAPMCLCEGVWYFKGVHVWYPLYSGHLYLEWGIWQGWYIGMDTKGDTWYDEIGLCVQNMLILSGSIVNDHGWEVGSMWAFIEKHVCRYQHMRLGQHDKRWWNGVQNLPVLVDFSHIFLTHARRLFPSVHDVCCPSLVCLGWMRTFSMVSYWTFASCETLVAKLEMTIFVIRNRWLNENIVPNMIQ